MLRDKNIEYVKENREGERKRDVDCGLLSLRFRN